MSESEVTPEELEALQTEPTPNPYDDESEDFIQDPEADAPDEVLDDEEEQS